VTEPIAAPGAIDEAAQTEVAADQALVAAAPPPPSTPRRIRSASALAIAVVIVVAGVLLTLGGVDALVRGGPATGPQPAGPAPSSVGPWHLDMVA